MSCCKTGPSKIPPRVTDSTNLHQLLKLRAEEDDPNLQKWLLTDHKIMYTSPKSQNDFLNVMANEVTGDIAAEIRSLPLVQFSVIVDGTQDISGDRRECVWAMWTMTFWCIRSLLVWTKCLSQQA